MTVISVATDPDGPFDAESAAIRRTASAAGLAMPLARRLNWLLRGSRVIMMQSYPSSVTALTAAEGRIYHRRSPNADRVLCLALIEAATSSSGYIKFKCDSGAEQTHTFPSTLATTRWGSPSWSAWPFVADLAHSGIGYHEVSWGDLKVRGLLVLELPRDLLDSTADTLVEYLGSGYAGLRSGRMVTDGSAAGLTDLLAATASARDATQRAGGGILLPSASAWALSATAGWENLADTALSTSGFGFLHRARQVREATTGVDYEVRIRARYTTSAGNPMAWFRMRSDGTSDTALFQSITTSWAWYAVDFGDTLSVEADDDDVLYPEGTVDPDSELEVSSIQWLE